jgi:hypothetical protein
MYGGDLVRETNHACQRAAAADAIDFMKSWN